METCRRAFLQSMGLGLAAATAGCAAPLMSGEKRLCFREGQPFRILQVSDTHYDLDDPGHKEVDALLEAALSALRPDLAIHTGDAVEPNRFREGWERLTAPFVRHGVPFAVTLGNHERAPAAGLEHRGVATFVSGLQGSLTRPGPADLPGGGTYALTLFAPDGATPRFALYCMDSQDSSVRGLFPRLNHARLGTYGWFLPEHVAWFRETARAHREANGGHPLPAAAFFHIPPTETPTLLTRGDFPPVGTPPAKKLWEAAPINTGMFYALLESRAVRCAFFGHAHGTDLAGSLHGLGLAYGRYSGGDNRRFRLSSGVRVIDIAPDAQSLSTFVWLPDAPPGPTLRFPQK